MKTLEAFWRWVDNEKPGTFTIIQKACGKKALTQLARTALDCAADVVWEMHKTAPPGYSLRFAFDEQRDDLRDVSIALLPALGKVIERRCAQQVIERRCAQPAGMAPEPTPGLLVVYKPFSLGKVCCTVCSFIYEPIGAVNCPSCGSKSGGWVVAL